MSFELLNNVGLQVCVSECPTSNWAYLQELPDVYTPPVSSTSINTSALICEDAVNFATTTMVTGSLNCTVDSLTISIWSVSSLLVYIYTNSCTPVISWFHCTVFSNLVWDLILRLTMLLQVWMEWGHPLFISLTKEFHTMSISDMCVSVSR